MMDVALIFAGIYSIPAVTLAIVYKLEGDGMAAFASAAFTLASIYFLYEAWLQVGM